MPKPKADDPTQPPDLDERGVVVITDVVRERLHKLGIIATEPAGSVRPCYHNDHKALWYVRPWPMGDMTCDICHPSLEVLQAEGYPKSSRQLGVTRFKGRHIGPPQEAWERPSSDLSGQVDEKSTLFHEGEMLG